MKKKSPAILTAKDKADWIAFIKKTKSIYDKDNDLVEKNDKSNRVRKLDLHGLSINEATKKVKKFILDSYEDKCKKIIIITGKGLRSKIYENPFKSEKMNILRYFVPEFIQTNQDLSKKIFKISKAELKDGGEGAIYVFLKTKKL